MSEQQPPPTGPTLPPPHSSGTPSARRSARSTRATAGIVAVATLATAGIVTAVVIGTRGDDRRAVPMAPPTTGAGATQGIEPAKPSPPPATAGVSTGSTGSAIQVQPDDPPQTPVATLPIAKPSGNLADGKLQCPTSVPMSDFSWLPKPANRLPSTQALVPTATPDTAVVCRYPIDPVTFGPNTAPPGARPYPIPAPPSGGVLWGRVVLTSGLDTLVADLATAPRDTGVPRACTAIGGGRTAYLLGLEYAGRVVWVRSDVEPNHCEGSTNADFRSSSGLGDVFAAAFTGKSWAGIAALNAKTTGCYPRVAFGQMGQESSLAPGEPVSVTICATPAYDPNGSVSSSDPQPAQPSVRLSADKAAAVLRALRALPGAPTTHGCQGPAEGKLRPTSYRVVLDYADGGSVYVDVLPGCRPEVMGMDVQSADGSSVVAAIKAVAPSLP